MGTSAEGVGGALGFLLFLTALTSAGSTVFTETEAGQVNVVTSHGAIEQENYEEQLGKIKNEYSVDDIQKMQEILEETDFAGMKMNKFGDFSVSEMDHEDNGTDVGDSHRRKRFVTNLQNMFWPKAIVPFDFNLMTLNEAGQHEVYAAQTLWEKYTCTRFVWWTKEETRTEYGLPDESHVTFTKGSSCSSHIGNIHSSTNGQWNSCCKRSTCIHELGHTMGLWHEHQNPLRGDMLRLERARIADDFISMYRAAYPETKLLLNQYDIASTMHYGNPFHVLYEDLRPIIKMSNQFYMYKDVALSHDCKGFKRVGVSMPECQNDGFPSVVDGVCSCLCPPGLEPSTGCTTVVKNVTTSPLWPAGDYALMAPQEGCPGDGVFQTGSHLHFGRGGNKQGDPNFLGGSFPPESFQYQFCAKTSDDNVTAAPTWETGRYCILRVGGECPSGFNPGSVQFDDDADQPSNSSGQLPDGNFTADTRLDFCCRDDGFSWTPLMNLPNTQPLVLFTTRQNSGCQEVGGMRYTKGWLQFDTFPELAKAEGDYPYGVKDKTLKMEYCYYVPAVTDCGGEIILSSSQKSVVITSPNFPAPYGTNMECNWFIKTENRDDRILLNFDVFELKSLNPSTCQDTLEIRYNMPGQPGIRYCGDGMKRTIRSLNDTVVLTLRTDFKEAPEGFGFNVTATHFSPAEEECYEPSTRGVHYRGKQDFTRNMRACVSWALTTHCNHHAFKSTDFGAGLEGIYCRNPDNTAMPWCYTDLSACQRDYCDVCNVERVYDREPLCGTDEVCSLSRNEILLTGCAATCGLTAVAAPDRDQQCGSPPQFPDGTMVGLPRSSYTQGETVTYNCSTGNELSTITCLSEGQWSALEYVCGGCSPGWAYRQGACYKLSDEIMTHYITATEICTRDGAVITSAKDEEELKYVSKLRPWEWGMWIGATDVEEEGSFKWLDGTPLNYTNWNSGEPNGKRGEDCAIMKADFRGNKWNDVGCDTKREAYLICKYTLSERTSCEDRVNCSQALKKTPTACSEHTDFANQLCAYSCGVCEADSTPQCDTSLSGDVTLVSPANATSVPRGDSVQFACQDGLGLASGQLTLACGDNGQFVGQLPQCQDPDTLVQGQNDANIINRDKYAADRYAYIGAGTQLTVQRHGFIKQWHYYSKTKGYTSFQVWRAMAGQDNGHRMVGQNLVLAQGEGRTVYDVPEEDWIEVHPGDRLGMWENTRETRGTVTISKCNSRQSKEDYGVYKSIWSTHKSDFYVYESWPFKSNVECLVFSYKAVIYPNDTVPSDRDRPTSQVSLIRRTYMSDAKSFIFGESKNFQVPVNGYITRWQFFVEYPGKAALQVWRPQPDLGDDKFMFIGQNKITLTSTNASFYELTVPRAEQIAVMEGDLIGIYYGSPQLGIKFDDCSRLDDVGRGRVRRAYAIVASSLSAYDVRSVSMKNPKPCSCMSLRAIVSQNPTVSARKAAAKMKQGLGGVSTA